MSVYFEKVMNECFDITDSKTRKTLLSLNEAGQERVLISLSNKLYGFIIDKVTDIDYGEIPSSKGDITKIPNYFNMVECLETIRGLLIEYKQSTDSVDTVLKAIDNIKETNDVRRSRSSMIIQPGCGFISIGLSISYENKVASIKPPLGNVNIPGHSSK